MAIILAIETSCDDTSVAILNGGEVLANVIASQEVHNLWGGIVPELASREHVSVISDITDQALKLSTLNYEDIDAVAVTNKPGLSGSLVVGTSFAKGLAMSLNVPIYPIDHIEGHIFSACIENPEIKFPLISLVVSGGHTAIFKVLSPDKYEMLGSTIDDAAGEAYDKTAKLLGLGYPGGPIIDSLAKSGNPSLHRFPRPMEHEKNYNFSFSGLKTSVRNYVQKNHKDSIPDSDRANICASVQDAINSILLKKTLKASKDNRIDTITVNGGVSANSDLRKKFNSLQESNLKTYFPSAQYSIDNAAMIAFTAQLKFKNSNNDSQLSSSFKFTVNPKPIRTTE